MYLSLLCFLFISSIFYFFFFFFLMIRRPPRSTLFPYTTPSDLRLNASNLFLSLILHLGNLFLIVQLHFRLKKRLDRKSGSAGMPRPISYAVFCLKKKKNNKDRS